MTTQETEQANEGWKWLANSPKWHYFREGRSLCCRWGTFAKDGFEQGKDNSPDNCPTCLKKLREENPTLCPFCNKAMKYDPKDHGWSCKRKVCSPPKP